MNTTPISFSRPIALGWNRMVRQLFKPFRLGHWFVLGFTAFLAGLSSWSGGGGGGGGAEDLDIDFESVRRSASDAWETFLAFQFGVALITVVIFLVVGVILLLLFVSSRGKLMFLDNVLHERAEVVGPWHRFRRLGNSLFGLRLVLLLVGMALVALVIFGLIAAAVVGAAGDQDLARIVPIALLVSFGLVIGLVALYVAFFVEGFVIPLMHRYDLLASEAAKRFLSIFQSRPWPFLACGLVVFVLAIAALFAVITFGLMTCCVGFLLLIVPYIGSVVTLPGTVFFRAFTVEFLAQFDPDLLAGDAEPPPLPDIAA